jgi:esterase/lipase superfamily enzyme/TRAP-type C4-dicarboxylate transport system substrate-binding protein
MSKHFDGALREEIRAARGQRDVRGRRRRNSLIFGFIWLVWAQVVGTPTPVRGQQHAPLPATRITVLIESNFQATGMSFVDQLSQNLPPEARENIKFESIVVPSSGLYGRLRETPWNMAVVSASALKEANAETTAVAFEMPFLFSNMAGVTAFQHSHLGQAGLSTLSGMTGLVYLNAGLTLATGRGEVKTPNDLKGRKVGVFFPTQQEPFAKIGSVPLLIPQAEAPNAVEKGVVDSIAISSANPSSWQLPARGFLLRDSIKAQVALVVTQDKTWEEIPFVIRAMIGDAAIATSNSHDRTLIEVEQQLIGKARSSSVSLVSFAADQASRATYQWIAEQPEHLRPLYSRIYDYAKNSDATSPRNPVVPPGRGGQVGRIYFATTRQDTRYPNFLYRFSDVRTDVVKCGEIEVSANETTLSFVGPITTDTQSCGSMLNNVLQSSGQMLIFVHGFNNRFSDAAERAMILKNSLGSNTDVVLWSWPSKRDGLAGKYDYDKESVTGIARISLVSILDSLTTGSKMKPLNILAHSMGGWHVLGALQILSGQNNRPELRDVVLAAPDIPQDEFGFAVGALSHISKRTTVYACGWDWALIISEDINGYPRAGSGGNNIFVRQPIESIDVDATLSTNHSYVFEAGKVLNDFSTLIATEAEPDGAARGLVKIPKAQWHYWRFPQRTP